MKAIVLVGVLFTAAVSSQNGGLPQSGPFKPGYPTDDEGLQVFDDAGRQPNATSSIDFERTFNSTQETWTWRVNVTEVAVPDNIYDIGKDTANFSKGLHVANTQWQLEWPGDEETLEELLTKRNLSVTIFTYIANVPSNITDNYKPEDNGDCKALLGDRCVAWLSAFNSTGGEGCRDTLGVNSVNSSGTGFELYPEDSLAQSFNKSVDAYHKDDTLYYRVSETYETGTLTAAKSALHILVMGFENKGSEQQGEASGPSVVCQIVDKDAADDAGSGDSGSDDEDKPGVAAPGRHNSVAAILVAVAFSTVIISW